MKAVVTGGAGFIGSHVADALLARGDEVMVIDNLVTGRLENLSAALAAYQKNLRVVKADIASEEALRELTAFKPEIVIHLAAQMNVRLSVKDPQFDARSNVLGTVNMLEAARQAGTRAFVFASSGGAIYGEQDYFPADEEHPIHPECPYGVAKKCGELYLDYYAHAYGMGCIALRFGNVYGPRQNPKGEAGVVAIFSERLLRGEGLTINGDGKQTRDFVFVADVVNAVLAAAKAAAATKGFDVYNVGLGKEVSLLDLVDGMRRAWSKMPEAVKQDFVPVSHGPALPGEQLRSVISPAKLGKAFNWRPAVALDEGLRVTIESFRPEQRGT